MCRLSLLWNSRRHETIYSQPFSSDARVGDFLWRFYCLFESYLNMAESVLSLCWKGYASELASEYKSLLENNFLVDCTVSAEGQSLKAHRLVLSACSPYFHMLFREESGKHPFVILLNASFKTVKSVIDFVYRGETEIPEGNLKEFLNLAQALQIKGLNAFTQVNNNNQSSNTTENVKDSSQNNQVTSEVQGIDGNLENYSQQYPHLTDGYSDTAQATGTECLNGNRRVPVPIQAFSTSSEKVQSTTLMTPLPEHHRPLDYDEVSIISEIPVKHEPLCHVFSENRNEILASVQSYKSKPGNFPREMGVITASVCGEENLNMLSSCSEFTLGNVEFSRMPPAEQQIIQLNDEQSFGGDVAERAESSQLPSLVPKRTHLDDEEIEEPLDDCDMPLNDSNETSERMEPAYSEENPDQCSSADGLPLEEDVATQRRSLPGQKGMSSPQHKELQLQEGRHAHPDQQTVLSDERGMAFSQVANLSTDKPRRMGSYRCKVCQKTFPFLSYLARHERAHTGMRPYRCDVCGKGFTQSNNLDRHLRSHSGERPYRCDVCAKRFIQLHHLNSHMRCHTGERPYRCDECGKDFRHKSSLSNHILRQVQRP